MNNGDLIFDFALTLGIIALLILNIVTNDSLNKRITILEQRAASRTATIEWHQNGDTLWVGRHIIIGEMP